MPRASWRRRARGHHVLGARGHEAVGDGGKAGKVEVDREPGARPQLVWGLLPGIDRPEEVRGAAQAARAPARARRPHHPRARVGQAPVRAAVPRAGRDAAENRGPRGLRQRCRHMPRSARRRARQVHAQTREGVARATPQGKGARVEGLLRGEARQVRGARKDRPGTVRSRWAKRGGPPGVGRGGRRSGRRLPPSPTSTGRADLPSAAGPRGGARRKSRPS